MVCSLVVLLFAFAHYRSLNSTRRWTYPPSSHHPEKRNRSTAGATSHPLSARRALPPAPRETIRFPCEFASMHTLHCTLFHRACLPMANCPRRGGPCRMQCHSRCDNGTVPG